MTCMHTDMCAADYLRCSDKIFNTPQLANEIVFSVVEIKQQILPSQGQFYFI